MLKGKVLFVLVQSWMKWLLERLCCLLIFQLQKPKCGICGMGSYSQDQFLPLYHTWSHFHSVTEPNPSKDTINSHLSNYFAKYNMNMLLEALLCRVGSVFWADLTPSSMFCNGSKRIKSSFPFVTPCFFLSYTDSLCTPEENGFILNMVSTYWTRTLLR